MRIIRVLPCGHVLLAAAFGGQLLICDVCSCVAVGVGGRTVIVCAVLTLVLVSCWPLWCLFNRVTWISLSLSLYMMAMFSQCLTHGHTLIKTHKRAHTHTHTWQIDIRNRFETVIFPTYTSTQTDTHTHTHTAPGGCAVNQQRAKSANYNMTTTTTSTTP